MKITDLKRKSDKDLQKLLAEGRENVRSLRFKVASNEVKNHQLLRNAKKDIARILTEIKQRMHREYTNNTNDTNREK